MPIDTVIVNIILPLSGINVSLLIWLVVKITKVETYLVTHHRRIKQLEDKKS